MPLLFLPGYCYGGGAILDFIKKSLMFVCLLKAVRGGWLKHSARYLSWVFIALQCFAINGCMGGILVSYSIANIGRNSDSFFLTFRSAIFLGIFLAFSIALSDLTICCLSSQD